MKKENCNKKEYIIIYRSQEHFEILGWVSAFNLEQAIKEAKTLLAKEIEKYNVNVAEIAEWKSGKEIFFDIE